MTRRDSITRWRAKGLWAGGRARGLANIRRASDAFAIDSVPGRGTAVRFSIRLRLGEVAG